MLQTMFFSICSCYAFSVFAVLPCLQSKRQDYVVVFMQLILSVDNFQGQVVSIFIVDQCVDLKILSVSNILLH